jgi:hypothetical protein
VQHPCSISCKPHLKHWKYYLLHLN